MKLHYLILLIFLSLHGFTQEQISLKQNIKTFPENGYALAKYTLQKSDLNCFAEFKQALPENIEIEPQNKGGAEFHTRNNTALFSWLRLPPQDTIQFSYKIIFPENNQKTPQLTGKFNYQIKNNLGTILLDPQKLKMEEQEEYETTTSKTDTASNKSSVTSEETDKKIQCYRKIQEKQEGYNIAIVIRNRDYNNNAEITELIPENYIPEPIALQNGSYSFNKNQIKIQWENMPRDSTIEVSYELIPTENAKKTLEISGTFTYEQNNRTKSMIIETQKAAKNGDKVKDAHELWGE